MPGDSGPVSSHSPVNDDSKLDETHLVASHDDLGEQPTHRLDDVDGDATTTNSRDTSPSSLRSLRRLAEGARVYPPHGEIARGGMGVILQVRDERLHRDLAMKVVLGQTSATGQPTPPARADSVPGIKRFLVEAQVTAQLEHPGVVPVHDLGVDHEGRVYFTMRLVRGQTLSEIMDRVRDDLPGWRLTRAVQIFIRVCETLAFAHSRGVIHRDLKPANIMIGGYGEVYVMDWGLAKLIATEVETSDDADSADDRNAEPDETVTSAVDRPPEASDDTVTSVSDGDDPVTHMIDEPSRESDASLQPGDDDDTLLIAGDSARVTPSRHTDDVTADEVELTTAGQIMGTPSYMSPEQALGSVDELDPRSDIYAVGAMLYRLLSGQAAYETPGKRQSFATLINRIRSGPPPSLRSLNANVSPELEAITNKAMARRREDRYQSADDLRQDLQYYIEGRVVRAYRTGPLVEARKWIQRNRTLAACLAALLTVTVVGSVAFGVQQQRASVVIARERDQAQSERRRAEGMRLAVQSQALYERQPTSALALAIEAARLSPGQHANDALLAAAAEQVEERTLIGPDGRVGVVNFSPDGAHVMSGDDAGSIIIWDLDGTPRSRFESHEAPLRFASYSHDGRLLVSGDHDGRTLIWDVDSSHLLGELSYGEKSAGAAAASIAPDDSFVVTASNDGRASVWQLPSRTLLRSLEHPAPVTAVAVSDRGDRIATATDDGVVRIWRSDSNAQLEQFTLPTPGTRGVADLEIESKPGRPLDSFVWPEDSVWFGADDRYVGVAVKGRGAAIWDVAARRMKLQSESACLLRLGPDGRRVAVAEPLSLWDLESGQRIAVLDDNVWRATFSPDGRYLSATEWNDDYTFCVWTTATGSKERCYSGHSYIVHTTAFSPDSSRIASGSWDSTTRIWRVRPELELGRDVGVRAVNSEGSLAVRATDTGVDLYDVVHQRSIRDLDWNGAGTLEYGHISAGDRYALVQVSVQGNLLWDLESGVSRFFTSIPLRITASADGETVVRRLDGQPLGVWRRSSPDEVRYIGPADVAYVGLDLSSDGRLLIAAEGGRKSASIWNLETGVQQHQLVGHRGFVLDAELSPCRRFALTTALDTTARLWDVATGQPLRVITGLPKRELAVAISPDSKLFAVQPINGRDHVFLYRLEDGQAIAALPTGDYHSAEFTADSRFLVTVDRGGAIRRWPTDPLSWAAKRLPGYPAPEFWETYEIGSFADRERHHEEFLVAHPSALSYSRRGGQLLERGDLDGALAAFQRLTELTERQPEGHIGAARVHARRSAMATGATAAAERELALDALELALRASAPPSADALTRPEEFAPLRELPRYRALVSRASR